MNAITIDEFYVSVGEVVAGKYRVEELLGVGGMAFVLSAKHVELEERFALKFLNRQFLSDPAIIERFTQEAKAACRIRSEHVARVYDVGTHNGAPFLVMEHLDGRDLCTVVGDNGPLSIESAVEYTMQACEALAGAHRHGIVHRDIKPENLFLVEHEGLPSIKVLDFGISKMVLAGSAPASRLTGQLALGTPCYMSPEQIRSTASVDERSDLWSLGVVLYELLAGREAFRATSVTEVCAAVLERQPEPLAGLRPDVPQGLIDVIARCLEKDPDNRYADVAELATALLPFAPSRALAHAERSSSVMKSAANAKFRERRTSTIRSFTGRAISQAPFSDAPVASDVGSRGRSKIGLGFAGAICVVALAIAGMTLTPKRAAPIEPAAAAAAPPTPVVVAPVVAPAAQPSPVAPAAEAPGAETPTASTPVAMRPRTPNAGFVAPVARRPAASSPLPVVSQPPKPSAAPTPEAAPSPAPKSTVDLGY